MTITGTTIENACLYIQIKGNAKRSWELYTSMVNPWLREQFVRPLDLRRSSKTFIPLYISTGCCSSKLEVRRKKDFPLKNKKCKCGKTYLIKWGKSK